MNSKTEKSSKLTELQKRFDRLLNERNKLEMQNQMQNITINILHKYISKLKRDNGIM